MQLPPLSLFLRFAMLSTLWAKSIEKRQRSLCSLLRSLRSLRCPFFYASLYFPPFGRKVQKNGIAVVWLTWSLPPHLPLPGFSRGLTSKLRHDHCRLADQLTWIPLPVTGLDFQPQTQTTATPSLLIFYFAANAKKYTISGCAESSASQQAFAVLPVV